MAGRWDEDLGDLQFKTGTKKALISIGSLRPFPRDQCKIGRETTNQQVENYLYILVC